LRAALRRVLPDYMTPATWIFLDALPLTPTGKLDRKALPAPESGRSDPAADYVAPRTPLEADLAAIWAEVMRIDRVGIHDDFFMLGGHSLLAVQIVARMSRAGIGKIAIKTLFDAPTVASLAAAVTQMPAVPVGGSIPRQPRAGESGS
jgi:hypothetical protein